MKPKSKKKYFRVTSSMLKTKIKIPELNIINLGIENLTTRELQRVVHHLHKENQKIKDEIWKLAMISIAEPNSQL